MLQRAAIGREAADDVPTLVHKALQGSGRPLDPATRVLMGSRFRQDFSRVRVHTDPHAAESARAVNARAYTVGRNVVFGAGQFNLGSASGRRLLAHELAHVVQQSPFMPDALPNRVGDPDDCFEREAQQAAQQVATNGMPPTGLHRASPVVQRESTPTSISVKEAKPFGHGDLKTDDLKQNWRTYIGSTTLMQVSPAGDYKGHCVKEFLTEVSNTCPGRFAELRKEVFCNESKCLDFARWGTAGDAETGKTTTDGPDTFLDRHRTRHPESLLEGTGKNECSVVCHQRYKFDRTKDLGSFYVIRNFHADKYMPPGAKTPLHVTTGDARKVPASLEAPSKEKFAKDIAPGLVKSKDLLSPPPVPAPQGRGTRGEDG